MSDLQIIAMRENASLASSWHEYLCVRKLEHGLFELSLRRYECLGEFEAFSDEDGNLPVEIDGKNVVSVEDGYVFGGELQVWDDLNDAVTFRSSGSKVLKEWLASKRWPITEVVAELHDRSA